MDLKLAYEQITKTVQEMLDDPVEVEKLKKFARDIQYVSPKSKKNNTFIDNKKNRIGNNTNGMLPFAANVSKNNFCLFNNLKKMCFLTMYCNFSRGLNQSK